MTEFDLQKAWINVLEKIRPQCAAPIYNTWVRWLEPASFDGQKFTIAAANAQCKTEMETKMSSLIKRIVADTIGKEVDVEFTVQASGSFEDSLPEEMSIRRVGRMLKDAIVMTSDVYVIPTYTLRWAPLLRADLMVLWWEAWRRVAGDAGGNIDLVEVGNELGFSDETLIEIFNSPRLGWVAKDGMFPTDLPLMPADCDQLAERLLELGIQDDVEKALTKAMELAPNGLLGKEPATVRVEHMQKEPRWKYVVDIVHELCGRRLNAKMIRLCEELHLHITQPDNAVTMAAYIFKKWRLILGSAATVFLVFMRNKKEWTGSLNEIGYLTGATLEEVRTWLEKDGSPIRQLLDIIAMELQGKNNGNGEYAIRTKPGSIPLSETDGRIYDRLLGLMVDSQEQRLTARLAGLITAEDRAEQVGKILQEDSALKLLNTSRFPELEKVLKQHMGGMSMEVVKLSLATLATLKAFQPADFKPKAGSNSKGWSFEKIMEWCDVNKDIAAELKAQETSAVLFVAWLIRGAGKPGITEPVSLAIKNLQSRPGVSPGDAPERLAELGPQKLSNAINRYMKYNRIDDLDLKVVFGEKPEKARVMRLADALGIEVEKEESYKNNWIGEECISVARQVVD